MSAVEVETDFLGDIDVEEIERIIHDETHVHIWRMDAHQGDPSLCGSFSKHGCPTAGGKVVYLMWPEDQCHCGIPVCPRCYNIWGNHTRLGC